jgi:hypothetical protein
MIRKQVTDYIPWDVQWHMVGFEFLLLSFFFFFTKDKKE